MTDWRNVRLGRRSPLFAWAGPRRSGLSLRHSSDPRLRSFIVNWLNPLGADPKRIATELDRIDPNAKPSPAQGQQLMDAVLFHPETSMRRALILALGTYGTEGLTPGEREPLTGKLLDLYRNDPDAESTERRNGPFANGSSRRSSKADAELMKFKDLGDRRWYREQPGADLRRDRGTGRVCHGFAADRAGP